MFVIVVTAVAPAAMFAPIIGDALHRILVFVPVVVVPAQVVTVVAVQVKWLAGHGILLG
jgi:hypothetical protein